MKLEKNTIKKPTAKQTLEEENISLKEQIERLLQDKVNGLTPKTDNDLLRAIYNWKSYVDSTTTELFKEKNSEIERLKAEIYRYKKALSELGKEEPLAETETEKKAYDTHNLFYFLISKKDKNKPLYIKDYLSLYGLEATKENIERVKSLSKDLPLLFNTTAEDNFIIIKNLIQWLKIGQDFIQVKFNDDIDEAKKRGTTLDRGGDNT